MRYVALATDYDGTLAHLGTVTEEAVEALTRFRHEGRKLILVTGRELQELLGIFPRIDLFHRVVAENGGLLYRPEEGSQAVLGEPPPKAFVHALIDRGVAPLSVGRCIVATVTPHESAVLAAIRDLGLELQVIFNKGAVMVLPAGVNKATGLEAALDDLMLSARNVVAVGDAENDHAMLRMSEFGVAVQNALPALKREADHVSALDHGAAVIEAAAAVLENDLAGWAAVRVRRPLRLGRTSDDVPLDIESRRICMALCATDRRQGMDYLDRLLDQILDYGYQCCVLDEEGDLAGRQGVVTLGSPDHPPTADEILAALENPKTSVVVDLEGLDQGAASAVTEATLRACTEMRAVSGRPHWCVWLLKPGAAWPEASVLELGDAAFDFIGFGATPELRTTTWPQHLTHAVALGQGAARMLVDQVIPSPPDALRTEATIVGGDAVFWSCADANRLQSFRSAVTSK